MAVPDPHALRRAQLKEAARLRAELNHDIALARIDFMLDTILPAKERIEREFAQGRLNEPTALDLQA